MGFKGVVFDFNGTLYWDTKFHNQAWDLFLARHRIVLSDAEKHARLHGKNNADIIPHIFPLKLSADEIEKLGSEKEAIYRDICMRTQMNLAPGAIELIEFLLDRAIPYTIATASTKENVEFYFEKLDLDRWFDRHRIVYNDGKLKSKPHPEIFQKAIQNLKLPSLDVVIFEDSVAGIRAAERASAGKIVIVNSNDEDYTGFSHEQIRSFSQVSRELFG
ncbi:MAG TPA: HAD family phosphatase [Spirochaetia bacterium]|nr:HAD family phosphatase [Spirochaetia bacterium]